MSKNSKLTIAIKEKYFDTLWYKTLVVLSNSKSILNTKYAPKEIRNNTIRVDQLIEYIKKDLSGYDKDLISNQQRMLERANDFLKNNVAEYNSIADKYKNSENKIIKDSSNDELALRLKEFRKERSKAMNIPAYYIFTDDELVQLVNVKPKNIEDLKKLLSPIKIKCHGEEIIKMINK